MVPSCFFSLCVEISIVPVKALPSAWILVHGRDPEPTCNTQRETYIFVGVTPYYLLDVINLPHKEENNMIGYPCYEALIKELSHRLYTQSKRRKSDQKISKTSNIGIPVGTNNRLPQQMGKIRSHYRNDKPRYYATVERLKIDTDLLSAN